MRDSVQTNLFTPSPFITHHSALNAMSLFQIHTHSHKAIPTHTYHFEDNQRDLYTARLCPSCNTNTVGSETHVIFDCPYSKHLAIPLIRKFQTLLTNAGQTPWTCLTPRQHLSLILGNPPLSLLKKLHTAWTRNSLKEILPYIASLEKLLYA